MLRDYQLRAIEFGLRVKTPYYAVDMGLGKTAIALHLIKQLQQPALVLGPMNVILYTWPEQIARWAPELSYKVLHGPKKSLEGHEAYDILLLNYDGLTWFGKQSCIWQKRVVIFDESIMVKSHSTNRFKLLKRMDELWSEYKVCLNATPAVNSLGDLWAQYYLLDKGQRLGKTITDFRTRYCDAIRYPGQAYTIYKVKPSKSEEIYSRVTDITFRLNVNDYIDMPEIVYNNITIPITNKKIREHYNMLYRKCALEVGDSTVLATSAAELIMKLRQFVQGGLYDDNKVWQHIHNIKLDMLSELYGTTPILCAVQFRGEANEICKRHPHAVVFEGPNRQAIITQWNKGNIPLLVWHPGSTANGLNLQQGGHTILWYALTYSLAQYIQFNGRLYRPGQTQSVVVHHLLLQNTIDEAVAKALQTKTSILEALLTHLQGGQKC